MLGLLLGTTSVLALGIPASYALANPVARNDWFLTEVPEGAVKFVMTGRTFSHVVMAYDEYHLNDPRDPVTFDRAYPAWEVLKHHPDQNRYFDRRIHLLRTTGTYWVGIPLWRSVKSYRFRWNERVTGKDGKTKFWPRPDREYGDKEHTDIMFVCSFPYEFILEGAETKDGFPIDVWYQVVLHVSNPYKAMFRSENWLQVVSSTVDGIVRDYVGRKTFDELKSELKERPSADKPFVDSHEFSLQVCEVNVALPDDPSTETDKYKKGLIGRFGVTLEFVNIQDFKPSGQHAGEYEKALAAEFLAERKAIGIRKEGDANAAAELAMGTAKARVIARTGAAEAYALKARLRALKDGGKLAELLVQTDAMKAEGAGTKVIWANNPFIQQSGLSEMLDRLGVTPGELETIIKEMLNGRRETV